MEVSYRLSLIRGGTLIVTPPGAGDPATARETPNWRLALVPWLAASSTSTWSAGGLSTMSRRSAPQWLTSHANLSPLASEVQLVVVNPITHSTPLYRFRYGLRSPPRSSDERMNLSHV